MADAVVSADSVEEHRPLAFAEAASEDLAVVAQNRFWQPVSRKREAQRLTDRLRRRPGHQAGRDAEAAVVIDARECGELGAIREEEPPDDVHLPQLHRVAAFPALVVLTPTTPRRGLDQAVSK